MNVKTHNLTIGVCFNKDRGFDLLTKNEPISQEWVHFCCFSYVSNMITIVDFLIFYCFSDDRFVRILLQQPPQRIH